MPDDINTRITIDPEQCGGRPCIRGMRIRVSDVKEIDREVLAAMKSASEHVRGK